MVWLVLILVAIGAAFYIVDKKIKEKYKFEEKFKPEDWNLPESSETTTDIKPQAVLVAPVSTSAEKVTYKKKNSVLVAAQEHFYNALQVATENRYNILTNINVADVLVVASSGNSLVAQVATKNIAGKQFDFILCEKKTSAPVCVIVLDETLPLFLSGACESAQLPVVMFRFQSDYDVDVLREKINHAVGQENSKAENILSTASETASVSLEIRPTKPTIEKQEAVEKEEIVNNEKIAQKAKVVEKEEVNENGIDLKFCPNCSAVMLKRKAKNGENAGQMFWLCSTYPTCRGMRPL